MFEVSARSGPGGGAGGSTKALLGGGVCTVAAEGRRGSARRPIKRATALSSSRFLFLQEMEKWF